MSSDGTDKVKESPVGNTAAAYKLAHDMRALEISQLANRNNFFMIFQGVLLAGLIQSQGAAAPIMNFCVCLAGMFISLFQLQMAGGAKYWQIRWEVAVKKLELLLLEDLKNEPRLVQLFTSDLSHLTQTEKERIYAINTAPARVNDKLNVTDSFIDSVVREDLGLSAARTTCSNVCEALCSPFRWAIARRYSVSRTPLYAAASLFCLWTILWLHTFTLGGKSIPCWLIGLAPWPEVFRLIPYVK